MIYFSDFGTVAAQGYAYRTAIRTSTGTQDLTVPGVTDTPVAVIVEMTRLTADGFGQVGRSGCQGFATTTSDQFVVSRRTGADPKDQSTAGSIIKILADTGTTVEAQAAITAFIAGGVTINVTTAPGSAFLVTIQVFCAANGYSAAKIGNCTATSGSTTAITPGIRADVLLAINRQTSGTTSNDSPFYQGMACYNGTTIYQCSASVFGNTPGGTVNWQGVIRDGAFLQDAANVNNRVTLSNITSTQFSLTGVSYTVSFVYFALQRTSNTNAWCGVVDSPSTTGSHTIGAVGFTPTSAMIYPTFENTASRYTADGTMGGQGRIAIDRGSSFQHVYTARDGSFGAANDSQGGTLSGKLRLYTHDGTASFDSTVTGLVSGGVAVNVTATAGANKMCVMLLG